MITLYENASWVAQHHSLLGLLCLVVAVLSATAFLTLFYTSLWEDKSTKSHNIAVCASLVVFIISGYLIVAIMMQGSQYSGTGDYKVKDATQNTEGEQILVVDDGKRNVELKVDEKDKESYNRGDNIRVEVVGNGPSLSKGEHYLGDIVRLQNQSFKSRVASITYKIEKVK